MPKSIAWFERLAYLVMALAALSAALHWSLFRDLFQQNSLAYSLTITGTLAVTAAVEILLIWLTARRRTNWSRWVWIILMGLTIGMAIPDLIRGTAGDLLNGRMETGVFYGMHLGALLSALCLVMPDARDWFRTAPPRY